MAQHCNTCMGRRILGGHFEARWGVVVGGGGIAESEARAILEGGLTVDGAEVGRIAGEADLEA